jgi:hypothetical protein
MADVTPETISYLLQEVKRWDVEVVAVKVATVRVAAVVKGVAVAPKPVGRAATAFAPNAGIVSSTRPDSRVTS